MRSRVAAHIWVNKSRHARSDAETGVVRSPCTDVYLRSERLR